MLNARYDGSVNHDELSKGGGLEFGVIFSDFYGVYLRLPDYDIAKLAI